MASLSAEEMHSQALSCLLQSRRLMPKNADAAFQLGARSYDRPASFPEYKTFSNGEGLLPSQQNLWTIDTATHSGADVVNMIADAQGNTWQGGDLQMRLWNIYAQQLDCIEV